MASSKALSTIFFVAFLLLLSVVVSSAIDMSIIDYDKNHGLPTPTSKRTEEEVRSMFELWLVKYSKNYTAAGEKEVRYQIFKDNLRKIDEHNAENQSFKLGPTLFSDLTHTEFHSKYSGGFDYERFKKSDEAKNRSMKAFRPEQGVKQLPSFVDWRTTGAVGPVRNQGSCSSCWAFTACATLSGMHQIKTGQYYELSPQQLVDCEPTHDPNCGGGFPHKAFEWIYNNGGITTENIYPYRDNQGYCNQQLNYPAVTLNNYKWVNQDENHIMAAVAQQPVAVAVDSKTLFQNYPGGIMQGSCGTNLDHAITIVGYGTENGQDYWLIKNSWGTNWGENGYGRLLRNVNQCGIAQYAVIPV